MLVAGEFTAAARAWDEIASAERDFAAVRFAHDLYLHVGDDGGRLASSARAAEAWRGEPGWGFVAGQHAFALEEVGRYGEAEELGRAALDLDPEDLWSRHALAHVYESTDDTAAALELLEGSVEVWDAQELLATHIWWHLALRLLASGDESGALAVFDERMPHASTAFQLCDQTSLLWRLEVGRVRRRRPLGRAGGALGRRGRAPHLRLPGRARRLDIHAPARPSRGGTLVRGLGERPSGTSENDRTFSRVVEPLVEAFCSYAHGDYGPLRRRSWTHWVRLPAAHRWEYRPARPDHADRAGGSRGGMSWDLTPEQRALQAEARALAREVIAPRAAEVDRSEQYPWDNVAALQQAGFTGMTVPAAHGGPGRSLLDAVLVVEEMAKVCGVTGRIAVECNMGALSAVMVYGTDAQREKVAALVLGGDKPAICITEPGAGSAASEMTTRADRSGDGYVLNGVKHWITGGGVSRTHLVFARVFDEHGNEEGIGAFLAFRDETPGLEIGPASRPWA